MRNLWGGGTSGIFQEPEWTLLTFSQDRDLKSQYNIDFTCNCGKMHIIKVFHLASFRHTVQWHQVYSQVLGVASSSLSAVTV